MNTTKVVRCPDGQFRHAIFSLGPYIADYPEQVWLSGIVSNWCPKYVALKLTVSCLPTVFLTRCNARPKDLDKPGSHHRTHEKTDFLIQNFDPGLLWDEFGIHSDIVVSNY